MSDELLLLLHDMQICPVQQQYVQAVQQSCVRKSQPEQGNQPD